jgi:hypothetical protein
MDVEVDRGHGRTEQPHHPRCRLRRHPVPWVPAGVSATPRHRRSRRCAHQQGNRVRHREHDRAAVTTGACQPLQSRRHWTVENRLHYVRDVTFREDTSQVRTGNAPARPPPSVTYRSTPSGTPDAPTSPTPAATYATTPTPSPSTTSRKSSLKRTKAHHDGAMGRRLPTVKQSMPLVTA